MIGQMFQERDNMACLHKAIENIVESNDPSNRDKISYFVEAFKAEMYTRGVHKSREHCGVSYEWWQ